MSVIAHVSPVSRNLSFCCDVTFWPIETAQLFGIKMISCPFFFCGVSEGGSILDGLVSM